MVSKENRLHNKIRWAILCYKSAPTPLPFGFLCLSELSYHPNLDGCWIQKYIYMGRYLEWNSSFLSIITNFATPLLLNKHVVIAMHLMVLSLNMQLWPCKQCNTALTCSYCHANNAIQLKHAASLCKQCHTGYVQNIDMYSACMITNTWADVLN